ncbi:hypothetical protein SH16_01987 [Aeromonas caviae]|uniref:hypothetical protein n=1 Tax=Aeromonas caviae TaxID=648 RepID=UPI0006580A8C|nr:hypothetical protein [Aeromonas caviae]KLV44133.1 hypothetical protein SH16_01987 [Aeromonas caviae]
MKLSYVILPLSLLLCSLDSYFRERGILSLFLLLMLLVVNRNAILNKRYIPIVCVCTTVFAVYTVLAFSMPSIYLEINADKANFFFKIFDRLSILALIIIAAIAYNRDNLIKSVILVANVHVVFFVVQFFFYYALRVPVDYLSFFSSELAQRNWMGFGGDNVFRASGLYFEPSNYAAYMSCYIAILILLKSEIKGYKYLYPVSMMLTLSSAGFIMGAISFLAIILAKDSYVSNLKKIYLFVLFMIAVTALAIPQMSRFSGTGVQDNANSNLRIMLITSIIESASSSTLKAITGTGIYSYSQTIYDKENSVAGREIASVQDASMVVYFFMCFGLFGLAFISWLFFTVSGLAAKLAMFSVLLSKLSFLFPIFPFLLVAIILTKTSDFNERV